MVADSIARRQRGTRDARAQARLSAVALLIVLVLGVVIGGLGRASAAPGADWSRMVVTRDVGESRADPAPLGDEVQAGPWLLTVTGVVTGDDATTQVTGASEFNETPADGFMYVLANVRAENTGDRPLVIDTNDFAVTGASGTVRRFVGAIAPDPALDGRVEPGESREGWIVVGAGADEQDLLLIYDSVTLSGNWADRVFALEDGAAVADLDQAPAEPNDAGSSANRPAGLGAAVATDDWVIAVQQVVTGQDVYNLYPASDYRTTALGDAAPGSVAQWIAFRVEVTNNRDGDAPSFFSPTAFMLADGEGDPALDAQTLTPPSPDASGSYYPGGSREGWIAFELPPGYEGTLLRFLPYQTDDDPRYITWGGDAAAATDEEEEESAADPVEITEGMTVRVTESVNLRSGPSTDDDVIATLDAGTQLTVTGPAEEGGDYDWYPVETVDTGESGFVAGDFLEPVGG